MSEESSSQAEQPGSSPASRGGAGVYIEGELGAFYLLAMVAGTEPRGLPGSRLVRVQFQGGDLGFGLDDLILHGLSAAGNTLLEIQSKREITFAPKDVTFQAVSAQIALTISTEVPLDRHFLSVATQRTSRRISGPYQDVLDWARTARSSAEFFDRVNADGLANAAMREFVSTFRGNLVSAGIFDEDETIWRILGRFLILEFDFESAAPMARTHALSLARQVLANEDIGRVDGLWRTLIEISIATGKSGGSLDREEIRAKLVGAGFRLAGDRDYAPARAKLAEMARMTLAGIGGTVAGVNLPRFEAVAALDEAADEHRFVELRGESGTGKSWVLRQVAERTPRQSPVIVLHPVATPQGGWLGFAQSLDIPGTAAEFLNDLAASGGAVIFIDSLDMFTDPARQLTVEQLLRAASVIDGFRVIATVRTATGDTEPWPAEEILAAFGGVHRVEIGELSDAEVKILVGRAAELRALLDPDHPAAKLARNLYRLSRLLKVPSGTIIRTEAALARYWWSSSDGAAKGDIRPAQRILADLAARAMQGKAGIELQSDSPARSHLLATFALKEVRRDQLDFYHDVLRDWAIGNYLAEDVARLAELDLSVPVSPRIARGIEFAGRLALEENADPSEWLALLARLSLEGAHSSWRRQALLAMVRSEAGFELVEKCSAALLAHGGALFVELCTTIIAVETVATIDIMKMDGDAKVNIPRWHRTNTTGSAVWALRWALNHIAEIPLQAIGAVLELVEIQVHLLKAVPPLAKPTAAMLFGWLRQLDLRQAEVTIVVDRTAPLDGDLRRRMIEKLRFLALLFSEFAPGHAKAYLTEIAAERDSYKVKAIRPLSTVIAAVAPSELSALVLASLIDKRHRKSRRSSSMERTFTFSDLDYMPPSPSQPPFLDLLQAAPAEGLALIRRLVAEAVAHYAEGEEPQANGFTLVFDDKARFFPWIDTYLWSRDQAREYSAASGLKALEAWSHQRVEDGETVKAVLADILGPKGSCAAYLLVAVDVLLSHFSQSREELVPFIACPELLAHDRMRVSHEQMDLGGAWFGRDEPSGKVTLADLKARKSRELSLMDTLTAYLGSDSVAQTLRDRLGAAVEMLDPYESHSNWVDPRFIGRFAYNMLEFSNWTDIGGGKLSYQSPPDEAAHLAQMDVRRERSVQSSETEARINLAMEGGDYATPETARLAAEYAKGALPDESETDVLKSHSTRLIATALLVARDGDDALLEMHETWVRQTADLGLREESERRTGSSDMLRFNRPALATLTLINLWLRKGAKADRNALIAIATRRDRCAVPAFTAALPNILETEPKLFKAAMRAAFANCLWRLHSYDEEEDEQRRFEEERVAASEAAISAEIAWLDGGNEPTWPQFPTERPFLRRSVRLSVPSIEIESFDSETDEEEEDSGKRSAVHVDSQAGAQWLSLVNKSPQGTIDWEREVVEVYSTWSAMMNGLGLPPEAEIDRSPADWNNQYYILFATALMDAPLDRFEADIQLVTRLPDEPFGDVAETLIHAADVLYFNNADRSAARPTELRARLADRVMSLRRWDSFGDPASLRIDHDTGGVVAKMLFNTYDMFNGTRSYLVPAVADRVDPLLTPIRPLLTGGPTSFVALCVMNLLLVTPRARHIGFLLDAADAWSERVPSNPSFWTALGTGRRIVEWFDAAVVEDPGLLSPAHPARHRIDGLLGQLVGTGVAEAHELEKKIEQAAFDREV